jgi:pilus assembly protein CpaB
MRGRGFLLILISIICASVAAVAASRWMSARAAALDSSKPGMVRVAVAAMEIPFGTKLEARHIATIEMIDGSVPAEAYHSAEDPVGKVAKATILTGEMLLKPRFVDQGAGSTLAAVVAPNMRAVSIRVDDVVGVGGFLLPGNRVDVVASYQRDQRSFADTILSDVKVLAVDQSAATESNAPVVVRAVTLEVTPEGAEALMKSRELGRLQLTLRNPMDQSVIEKKEAPAAPAIVKRVEVKPVAAPTIQVIRGTRSVSTARNGS